MKFKINGKTVHFDRFHFFICAVTIFKIILMGLFTSDYQNELFIPFVTDFITNGGNPYQKFFENGVVNAFPYPTVMLLIESFGAILIKLFGFSTPFMVNAVFKIPSLILDFVGLYFLVKIFPEKRRYAAVFYFASPVVIYATYMHGQLDLVPTVLLFVAVYYISSKNKYRCFLGVIFLVIALLSKLHILAVLPIVFLYLWKRDGVKKTMQFSGGVVIGTVIGMLPFISKGYLQMVLFNSEQNILTQISIKFVTVEMYIPIVAVLLMYLIAFQVNLINRDLFISLCGIVFAVFLAFCPPMPGWYVWIVPYVTVFFISVDLEKYKNIAIYVLLNFLYLIYFVFLHSRSMVDLYLLDKDLSFIKVENSTLTNLFFTLLSGTLVYIIFSMYQLGIASNSLYKRRNFPFTIGIAGDSGSGKSTLIDVVERCLGRHDLLYIEGDGDHRWERGEKQWKEFTHLNPKANYLYRQATDLKQLRVGNPVKRVEYNHDTGKFTDAKKIKPKRYVILCGLHSLYLPQARKYLDLKIYMDVDETLRKFWKIQRDIAHRGYSKEKILEQIEERIPDAEKYIYPQRKYADMSIQYYDRTLYDCMAVEHQVHLSVRITVSATINIEPLVDELIYYGIKVVYDYSEDLRMQTVDMDAIDLENADIPIETIAERIVPQLEEITRENLNDCDNAKDGIIMLFLLLSISSKMQGEV